MKIRFGKFKRKHQQYFTIQKAITNSTSDLFSLTPHHNLYIHGCRCDSNNFGGSFPDCVHDIRDKPLI